MSQRTGFFLVAFFCNLWVSGWKLRTYHIRARRWSVRAVCGDAVCINHVYICRQAQRHHPSARAAPPTARTSTSRILPLRTEAATRRGCIHTQAYQTRSNICVVDVLLLHCFFFSLSVFVISFLLCIFYLSASCRSFHSPLLLTSFYCFITFNI